jgi:hypothetical protein
VKTPLKAPIQEGEENEVYHQASFSKPEKSLALNDAFKSARPEVLELFRGSVRGLLAPNTGEERLKQATWHELSHNA